MRLVTWGVGLAVALCAFVVVQGCVENCIPNKLTCGDISKKFKVQKPAPSKGKGSCIFKNRGKEYPGTKRTCCQSEEDYANMLKQNEVSELLGALSGAEIGEYPHQIKLVGDKGSCGGTIYNEEWIITAAHCIRYQGEVKTSVENGFIIAGQTDVNDATDDDKYYFQKIIVHEWWNEKMPNNGSDIALLHLKDKLKFIKGKIQPLQVESKNFKPRYGGKALTMGFGVASEYGAANHLQEAEVPIHEPSKASRLSFDPLNGASVEPEGGFSPLSQHLAVAGDDSGFTVGQGDSGGPIICADADNQSKPVLCGVASFKFCELKKVCRRPSYFLRIAPFLDWISLKTNKATQPKKWLVNEPMHPLKLEEDDIPGYLVRLTSAKKSCMGTMIAVDRLITSKQGS